MRVIRATVGHAYFLTQAYAEWLADTGKDNSAYKKHFEAWLYRFADPNFVCFLGFHGRKVVGMSWGYNLNHEPVATFRAEGFFVRRGFRKFRFVKAMFLAGKSFLIENDFKKLMLLKPQPKRKEKIEGVLVGVNLG